MYGIDGPRVRETLTGSSETLDDQGHAHSDGSNAHSVSPFLAHPLFLLSTYLFLDLSMSLGKHSP
jgi:hypothetical protein